MFGMFQGNYNLDVDLGNWDMSKVEDIGYMFKDCTKFTGKGLEKWKLKKDINIEGTFINCYSFKDYRKKLSCYH